MKKSFAVLISFLALIFCSCYTPNPLYGKWADNQGNYISFMNDGSVVAKIYKNNDGSNYDTYSGTWQAIDNVVIFTVTKDASGNETPTSKSIVSEWDINGAMLKITWVDEDKITRNLTLYHSSK